MTVTVAETYTLMLMEYAHVRNVNVRRRVEEW
jgi:hypothetical protein